MPRCARASAGVGKVGRMDFTFKTAEASDDSEQLIKIGLENVELQRRIGQVSRTVVTR
jgi:hypothetical protein